MKPAPFDYYAPATVEEAVALLEKLEDDDVEAKIIAGGQSLTPMLNLRVARPDALVDLRRLSCLDYIREDGDVIAIGAMTSKSDAEDSKLLRGHNPLFQRASELIGHRQIRNRGTVGGSFAHADPAAEYGAVAMVCDIELKIAGTDGERTVPSDEFYVTFFTTDIDSTEILTEVRVPALPAGSGWAIQEICRRDGDLAVAGVAVTLRLQDGRLADTRIGLFGVNGTPSRLTAAEQLLDGQPPAGELFESAGKAGAEALDEPISDVHGSGEYRRQLVSVLVARCLAEAVARVA